MGEADEGGGVRRVLIDGKPWLVDDKSAEAMLADGRAESPTKKAAAKSAPKKRAARKRA